MWEFILFFAIMQLINVILNTLKVCVTAKGKKFSASIISALTYGFYTFVIVFTANDFNIWIKAGVTAITNLFGVWLSMWILELIKKNQIWQIVIIVEKIWVQDVNTAFVGSGISYTQMDDNCGHRIYHFYSHNKKQSEKIKELLKGIPIKYVAFEPNVKL